MSPDIQKYNKALAPAERAICDLLAQQIASLLKGAEAKVWHGHPVWFLTENPIVGYSKMKIGVQLLFWSGQSFGEEGLAPQGKYKAAGVRYAAADEVDKKKLKRYLKKAAAIQWDYKNLVKRRGVLEPLKGVLGLSQ